MNAGYDDIPAWVRNRAAENLFTRLVRDLDRAFEFHGDRLDESDKAVLREAQERLGRHVEHIVAVRG